MKNEVAGIGRSDLVISGPLGSAEAYIDRVFRIPLLTREREIELAIRLRQNDDIDAAKQLILSHLRFVVYVARRYRGYGVLLGDIIQEGNIGLMKAIKRFDPAKGVRLATFAVHWIRAEIHEYLYRNWRLLKVVTTKAQRKLFFKLRGAKQHLGWLTSAETAAVAAKLDVADADVREMEQRIWGTDVSVDHIANDFADRWAPNAADLANPSADPLDVLTNEYGQDGDLERMREAIRELDARAQDVLRSRWFADEKATLQDLADRYGVSAERIRQIEKRALSMLKDLIGPRMQAAVSTREANRAVRPRRAHVGAR